MRGGVCRSIEGRDCTAVISLEYVVSSCTINNKYHPLYKQRVVFVIIQRKQ